MNLSRFQSKAFFKLPSHSKYRQALLATLSLVLLLTLIPILYLSVFNAPCADDFNYSVYTYQTWQGSHSIVDLFRAALWTATNFWQSWQGTYSASFLMSLQPAIFGFEYYAATTILIMGSVLVANWVFSSRLCSKPLGLSIVENFTISILLTILMIQWIPSPVQGLYWYNGAVYYVFFHSLFLIFVCLVLSLSKEKSAVKFATKLGMSVFGAVFIAGGNYVTAFGSILFLIAITIFSLIVKNKAFFCGCSIILAALLVGFIFNASCPGTQIRSASIGAPRGIEAAMNAILNSIAVGVKYIATWTTSTVVAAIVLFIIILYPAICRQKIYQKFRFPCPIIVTVLSVCWICAMFCPPMYAEGDAGAGRLINIIYFDYIVLIFLNVFYYCGWYARLEFKPKLKPNMYTAITVLKHSIPLIAVILLGINFQSSVCLRAIQTLDTGNAQRYALESRQRNSVFMASTGKDVEVLPYSVKPELLYFDDITSDPYDWRNQSLAKYYDLNSVTLKTSPVF